MVSVLDRDSELRRRAWDAAASVVDPEIPVLTIADLGVLREVRVTGEAIEVVVTPTYSGCPAMAAIVSDVAAALRAAGLSDARVVTTLSPAWTTDWISAEGRRKLRDYGIAPPPPGGTRHALFGTTSVACPRCGAAETEQLAEFGSTSCKALWRCRACREPFDLFKCH